MVSKRTLAYNPPSVEQPSIKMAKHPSMVSGNPSVRFGGDNKLVLCLTEG
jgi:hypothetical protein